MYNGGRRVEFYFVPVIREISTIIIPPPRSVFQRIWRNSKLEFNLYLALGRTIEIFGIGMTYDVAEEEEEEIEIFEIRITVYCDKDKGSRTKMEMEKKQNWTEVERESQPSIKSQS